ncbi:MAG: GvpL/GvpF family gas vesicle protein [Candidatus Kuenenia sp.]|nr:GvpL/GvpF family gas vesicle protein [Candidatus Kuenenia sp.]
MGIYIYCLIGTPVTFPSTMTGIDGVHAVEVEERDGIFAVLSHVPLTEYNEEALEKNITDVAWLAPRAKRHEEIIEFVMTHTLSNQNEEVPFFMHKEKGGEGEKGRECVRRIPLAPQWGEIKEVVGKCYTPVVPLRFCTLYKNREGLFKAVMPHKEKIHNFLDYTADKTEWAVKVFCDKTVFLNKHDKNKEQSQEAKQTSLLPGEAYLLAKKTLREREERFGADLQTYLKDIDCALSQYADHRRFLHCTGKRVHGRPLDMVMNTACLVEQQTFTLFKDTLDILAEKYKDEGVVFEMSGPWPPYNFCPEL